MRVGLLQVRLRSDSPAANVQVILAAIDRAGRADPSPDLLVLPGGCDTGGKEPAGDFPLAVLETTREAIASKAREWGLYIAAGVHTTVDGRFEPASVLLDPDGDIVAAAHRPSIEDERQTSREAGSYCPSIGPIEMACRDEDRLVDQLGVLGAAGGLVVAPFDRRDVLGKDIKSAPSDIKNALCGAGNGNGIYLAVVRPAGAGKVDRENKDFGSFVCGPDGNVLAAVEDSKEGIAFTNVPLDPPSP